jgi:putative hemolysin
MTEPLLIAAAIVALLLGNGFFSGSEIAIISARRGRIERLAEHGNRAAQRVREMQGDMDRFLATVQIGVTVCGTLAGVLGGVLAERYLEPLMAGSRLPRFVPAAVVASGLVGIFIVYVEPSWCWGSWSRRRSRCATRSASRSSSRCRSS